MSNRAVVRSNRAYSLAAEAKNLGGQEASFVANVILCNQGNPEKKLNGLVDLLRGGHKVRLADFSIDILIVDDDQKPWRYLEECASSKPSERGPGRRPAAGGRV